MKNILFILIICVNILCGYSECKTDIYFANGILTDERNATKNTKLLRKRILLDIYGGNLNLFSLSIGKVERSYNQTQGSIPDILEALRQKLSSTFDGDKTDEEIRELRDELKKDMDKSIHSSDLTHQVNAYMDSINKGKNILVVAHSQGNLFAYQAYRLLDNRMKPYFDVISVASPVFSDVKPDTPIVSWDNDFVARLGLYGGLITNEVRKVWLRKFDPKNGKQESIGPYYTYKHQVGLKKNGYDVYEPTFFNKTDTIVHSFRFYMGLPLGDTENIKNIFDKNQNLVSNIAKDKIIKHIKDKLPEIDSNSISKDIKPKTGDVEVNLEWRSRSCKQSKLINLDLETDWDKGEIDVKDNGLTYEHFVIESEHDIYPGTFSFFARDRSDQTKLDSHEMYVKPVDIFVDVKTPGNVNMRYKAQAKTPEQLNVGKLFEIIIEYKKIKFIPSKSVSPSKGTDIWREVECEGEKSCGCIPCEYKVTSALQEVKLGPLSGASLTISEAYNPSKIVYIGKTTEGRDIYTTGIIDIPYEEYSKFDDDKLYLIKAQGGLDIDSNDDFIIDKNPVQNGGTLYTIVSGYEMKHLAIKVNILSNIAYHVSKDLLNDKSKKDELIARLDDVAKRVLKRKVFPIQGDYNIKYTDILSWLPTIDKSLLFKDYDKNVHPIVEMVYKDEDVTTQSYDFVYKSLEKGAPEVYGFGAKVSINAPANSIVGMLDIKSIGSSDIKSMILSGDGKENFKIDTKGILRVLDKTNFDGNGTIYKLEVVAINEDGKKSLPASVVVEVLDLPNIPYLKEITINDLAENSQLKDVGRVVFKDKESVITDIVLKGNGSEDFTIDNDGYIRVKDNVDIDYERRQTYSLKAIATNAQGNDSVPVAININVIDDIDTPFLQLVLLAHVDENVDVGTKIANVQTVKDGKSEITGYSIVGTTSMPINIDDNGTLYVDGFINFEEREEYNFMVVAHSKFGDSNRVLTTVVVNDIAEYIVPLLKDFNGTVKEDVKHGDIVGQISIEQGEMPIQSMTLKGIGAENFTIDNDGVIKVSQNAFFDFNILTKYNLEVYANTKSGSSSKSRVSIVVEDVKNLPPKVSNTLFSVSEDVNISDVVGTIKYEKGDGNITGYSISGKGDKDFIINENGEIIAKTILDYLVQNRYVFDITLSNEFGKSNVATIVINVEQSKNLVENKFKKLIYILHEKCKISQDEILKNLDKENFIYKSDINCSDKNITDKDLSTFSILNKIDGYLNISKNNLSSLRGLENISTIDGFIDISKNQNLTDISALENLQISTEKTIYLDEKVFTTQINENSLFCQSTWDLKNDKNDMVDDMSKICNFSKNISMQGDNNNTYIITQNSKIKQIEDAGGIDSIVFDGFLSTDIVGNINKNNINIFTKNDKNIYVELITIKNFFLSNSMIENFIFDDRTLNNAQILHNILATNKEITYAKVLAPFYEKNIDSFMLIEDLNDSGDLTFNLDGTYSFVPKEIEYLGDLEYKSIYFTYAYDGNETSQKVTLYIEGENDAPIAKEDASFVDLSRIKNENARQIVKGNIVEQNNTKSVDQWIFDYDGGNLIIDVLSELSNTNNSYIDLDQNGVQEGVDVYIYLFKQNDENSWQLISSNDDSDAGKTDGSTHQYDSYLDLNLEKGIYLLAAGGYNLSAENALLGYQSNQYKGPYQVSFNENLKFLQIPKTTLEVSNSSSFAFNVLANDTDIDIHDTLFIKNAYISDENANPVEDMGKIFIAYNKIYYYPEKRFDYLQEGQSEEVNIVYTISDGNLTDKSVLTLKVIPSTLTHVNIKSNQNLLDIVNAMSNNTILNKQQ